MSKGNPFLGLASGKLGDLVLYRSQGQQIARARNRSPKNPQSGLQMAQRSMMKTAALAYSLLQPIADHSFQGLQEGTPNQSRFTMRNIYLMRDQLGDFLAGGDASAIFNLDATNFAGKYDTQAPIRPYLVSEGNLPTLNVSIVGGMPQIAAPAITGNLPVAYGDAIAALGLQQGDQLTFCFLYTNDTAEDKAGYFTSFDFARVILDPDDGDVEDDFIGNESMLSPSNPNPRNEGSLFLQASQGSIHFLPVQTRSLVQGGLARSLAGVAVIVSRFENGAWRRSSQQVVLMPQTGTPTTGLQYPYDVLMIGDAATSWLKGQQSSLYLNQAG